MKPDDYIIEFITLGNSVKVTAIDSETGAEAVIVGAPSLSPHELGQMAVRKLKYVLNKEGSAP